MRRPVGWTADLRFGVVRGQTSVTKELYLSRASQEALTPALNVQWRGKLSSPCLPFGGIGGRVMVRPKVHRLDRTDNSTTIEQLEVGVTFRMLNL